MKKPDWLDRVQFIVSYIMNPCDNPAIIYIETAKPALGQMVLSYVMTDLTDIVRAFFRPKGLRWQRHGRKKTKPPKWKGIPELSEMVGEHIPYYEPYQAGIKFEEPYRVLWVIDGFIQRLCYYIMVFDLVTEFGYEWISNIFTVNPMGCKNRVAAMRSSAGVGSAFPIDWTAQNMNFLNYQHGIEIDNYGISLPEGKFFIVWAARVRNDGPDINGTQEVQLALVNNNNYQDDFTFYSTRAGIRWNEETDLIAQGICHGPASYTWELYKSFNRVAGVSGAYVFVTKI